MVNLKSKSKEMCLEMFKGLARRRNAPSTHSPDVFLGALWTFGISQTLDYHEKVDIVKESMKTGARTTESSLWEHQEALP